MFLSVIPLKMCAATTEVFLATVEKGRGDVMVTCHFTDNSLAKGCVVKMKILQDFTLYEAYEEIYVARCNKNRVVSQCIRIPVGSYAKEVEVKDWKIDATTGSHSVSTFTATYTESPCELLFPGRLVAGYQSMTYIL